MYADNKALHSWDDNVGTKVFDVATKATKEDQVYLKTSYE